ncbi:hypothetical protein CXB77_07905 [Chromatium okenii]|uniref:Uncharacterized protein n=1 Tax=Chromatium okenii TaxID=61644 RepID=A0A2S7XSF9_9GAMM|nr:hypothetical protein CXB77_07905 [Chromatium okenii]
MVNVDAPASSSRSSSSASAMPTANKPTTVSASIEVNLRQVRWRSCDDGALGAQRGLNVLIMLSSRW